MEQTTYKAGILQASDDLFWQAVGHGGRVQGGWKSRERGTVPQDSP